jgi:hypothetical protein
MSAIKSKIKPNPTAWTVNSLANGAGTNYVSVGAGGVGGVGATGSAGIIGGVTGPYYTNASNGINTTVDAAMIINQGRMTVTVPLDVNGIDVEQVLKDLMQVTGVVARNRQLEAKYKGLKKSGEEYQLLLQKVQSDVNIVIKRAAQEYRLAEEKYKVFETIKDSK